MSTAGEDLSMIASTATVAGSSVAATEAEEDASSFAGSDRGASVSGNGGRVILTKEKSVTDIDIGDEEDDEEDEYTAPMHLHALRTPAKLKGARSRSSSRSRPGSRRNSPSPPRSGVGKGEILGSTISPTASVESDIGNRSHTSGGSDLDPDILLDKLGFRDLDPNATQEELQELLKKHISSNNGLPTLNERMSEETIDDVHAFQDLVYKKIDRGDSRRSICEEDEEHDEDDDSPNKARRDNLKKADMGLSSLAVMGSTTSLLKTLDEAEEDGLDDEEDEAENNGDVLLEIPDGMVSLGGASKSKGRLSMNTSAAVASASSIDNDDDDDDDAEVEVPMFVLDELNSGEGKRTLRKRSTEMAVAGSEMSFLEADEQDGLEADLASSGDEDEKR